MIQILLNNAITYGEALLNRRSEQIEDT